MNDQFSVCRAVPWNGGGYGRIGYYHVLVEIDGPMQYNAAVRVARALLADAEPRKCLLLYNDVTGRVTPVYQDGAEAMKYPYYTRRFFAAKMQPNGISRPIHLPDHMSDSYW